MKYKMMFIDAPIIKTKQMGIPFPEVDGLRFTKDIEAAILEKEREGYELFSMNPVNSGKPKEGVTAFSITTGMILTFKK